MSNQRRLKDASRPRINPCKGACSLHSHSCILAKRGYRGQRLRFSLHGSLSWSCNWPLITRSALVSVFQGSSKRSCPPSFRGGPNRFPCTSSNWILCGTFRIIFPGQDLENWARNPSLLAPPQSVEVSPLPFPYCVQHEPRRLQRPEFHGLIVF